MLEKFFTYEYVDNTGDEWSMDWQSMMYPIVSEILDSIGH